MKHDKLCHLNIWNVMVFGCLISTYNLIFSFDIIFKNKTFNILKLRMQLCKREYLNVYNMNSAL